MKRLGKFLVWSYLPVMLMLLVIFSTVSFGQSAKEQLAVLQQQAAPLLAQREENKKTLATLTQTKSDIDFGYEALGKGAAKYKTAKEGYDVDLGAYTPAAASLNSALDAHNANQCQGNNCGWYNQEANNLNARRDQLQTVKNGLDSRKSTLDATLGSLRELQSVMQAKFEKYTADSKAYNAQNDENEAKIKAIADKWNAVLNGMGDCYKNLPANASDEQVHEACGAAWDGNSVGKPAVVNRGTGGATPNN